MTACMIRKTNDGMRSGDFYDLELLRQLPKCSCAIEECQNPVMRHALTGLEIAVPVSVERTDLTKGRANCNLIVQ